VLALYSRTASKNSKLAAVTEASNISALSKLVVQLFEPMYGRQFRSVTEATALFQTKLFAIMGPNAFLCLLSLPPKIDHTDIELGVDDGHLFVTLQQNYGRFQEAGRLFLKRKQGEEEEY
jgi:hypothetical protein